MSLLKNFIKQKTQLYENFNIKQFYKLNGIKPFYNALITTYLVNTSLLIQIPIYEKLKNSLDNKKKNIFNIFLITVISKSSAALITYPFDTIRTIKREKIKLSNYEIIKLLNKNYLNYYKGLHIYLLRSLPYHTSVFCTYEFLKFKF